MKSEEKNRPAPSRSGSGRRPGAAVPKKTVRPGSSSRRGALPVKRTARGKSHSGRQERSRPRTEKKTSTRQLPRTNPTPSVVYSPGLTFDRKSVILRLITVIAVVLALTGVFSLFFKVKTITVSGNDKYDGWTITEASGIKKGDSLLGVGKAGVGGRIQAALPYVNLVRVGIKLPDTVNIEIEEIDVVYAIAAEDNSWWLMTAQGKIVEEINEAAASKYARIQGVTLAVPVGKQAQAYESSNKNAFGDTVPVSDSAEDHLNAALTILQNLEKNSVLDKVTEVDVADLEGLQMRYLDKYQIKLGDHTRMDYKISSMAAVFQQENFSEAGSIDVSFTNMPDTVIFKPFG